MLLGVLGASLLGNMLIGQGIIRAQYENKKEKGILRAGYGSKSISRVNLNLMEFILEMICLIR